jgi:hypothetical protein
MTERKKKPNRTTFTLQQFHLQFPEKKSKVLSTTISQMPQTPTPAVLRPKTSKLPEHIKSLLLVASSFELVIRASKELEYILDTQYSATGNGLHEKITSILSAYHIDMELLQHVHHIATLRNKLVHEYDFSTIEDRALFQDIFVYAYSKLKKSL